MKLWQNIKKWLCGGCVYFTAISLAIILINFMVANEADFGRINTVSFLLIFPLGLCLSAAGLLLRAKQIARWVRYLSHYIITVLSAYIFLWLPSNTAASPSTPLLMLVLFTVLYWIFFGLILLIKARIRRLMEEDD